MKTYSKIHTTRKALDSHLKKIENRGGKATIKNTHQGFLIEYVFPAKATKKAAPKKTSKKPVAKPKSTTQEKILFDVMSPDGFTIRMPGDPLFKTRDEGFAYFKKWKRRYQKQGYYSSNYGRIALADLKEECYFENVPASKADSWLGFTPH